MARRSTPATRWTRHAVPTQRSSRTPRRTAARFTAGAVRGMTTWASRPVDLAANAKAWAWLPELCVTRGAFGGACSAAFVAPRILNDPVRWKTSHLNFRERPANSSRPLQVNTGVRWTCGSTRFAASTTSAGVTGKSDGSGCGGVCIFLLISRIAAATPATALASRYRCCILLGISAVVCLTCRAARRWRAKSMPRPRARMESYELFRQLYCVAPRRC